MKVVVASFPKCGTKTLHKCLEVLGYSVYDFDSHLYHQGQEWMKILAYGSTPELFRKMYENVDCVCGSPAFYYWEEIHKAFPESKIIFTMRHDEDEWYRSYKIQRDAFRPTAATKLRRLLTPTGWKAHQIMKLFGHVAFGCPPQRFLEAFRSENAENTKKIYRKHNDSVLKRAPKDKLLVLDFADGWKPLCEFLGKDIPDIPFPHENVGGELVNSLANLPLYSQIHKEFKIVMTILFTIVAVLAFRILF